MDRIPRLGAAPDERPDEDRLSDRRRFGVRAELRRGEGVYGHAARLFGTLPERGEARIESALHHGHREPRDGADHGQTRPEQGAGRVAEEESAGARQMAGGGDDDRREGWV